MGMKEWKRKWNYRDYYEDPFLHSQLGIPGRDLHGGLAELVSSLSDVLARRHRGFGLRKGSGSDDFSPLLVLLA